MKPTSILFVCLGNICRSPTAHGVFESLVETQGLANVISVDSAGTGDWHIGSPPDNRATDAALVRGYKLAHLRARQIAVHDFVEFDHILAMDLANLSHLERMVPAGFFGHLGLFLDHTDWPKPAQVPDPYGGGADGFEQVLTLIENASAGLLDYLKATTFT